uniref:aldo/keto reductase n=1 Tax=Pseudonocardia pini TaxID=2758030 RepID=UPI0028B16080
MRLGSSDLEVAGLCLGGNTFGWTSDEAESHAVLDAFVAGGGTLVDTADQYSCWIPGNSGGESERIIGSWLAARGRRDDVLIATKVGKLPGFTGLAPATVAAAANASLARLGVDHVDLYYAHADDETVPLEESLGALDALVRAGKVRYLAASNFSAKRLAEALDTQQREGFAPFVALQTKYNLLDREEYETELAGVLAERGVACLPYLALANGV